MTENNTTAQATGLHTPGPWRVAEAEGLREVDVLGIVRDYAIKVASAALAVASAR